MAVYPSRTYTWRGYRANIGPILTPNEAAPDMNNNANRDYNTLTALLNGHLLQLVQPEPIPRIPPQPKITSGYKRKRPNGES